MASNKAVAGSERTSPTEAEKEKIDEVIKLLDLIATKFPAQCEDATILRFLRARNFNAKKAAKMFKENFRWRILYEPDKIQWHDVAKEAETGKIYRANYADKSGRTVLVLRPGYQNTNCVEDQIRYLVYCLESAISRLEHGKEEMVWLIDFDKWNASCISVKATRETARVLQNHYPERLGIAILYNPPKLFESFWLLVKPFLEHKTYKKVKFVYSDQPHTKKIMEALFDMDKLEPAFGGTSTENFHYEAYATCMKAEERQKAEQAKNSCSASETANPTPQESDLMVSEFSSEVSDEADSSSHTVDDEDELESIDQLHIGSSTSNIRVEKSHDKSPAK